MTDDSKLDQEPAEGSRETVERELARKDKSVGQEGQGLPPAGPHAKEELTNHDATPGAGALPEITSDDDVDAGTG
jgi:hypothetical protein